MLIKLTICFLQTRGLCSTKTFQSCSNCYSSVRRELLLLLHVLVGTFIACLHVICAAWSFELEKIYVCKLIIRHLYYLDCFLQLQDHH